MIMKVGILTLSDKGARGERIDRSGPELVNWLTGKSVEVVQTDLVPDDQATIVERLCTWADHLHLDLVLTTGGTGVSPRDVTPEATRKVIERELPGFGEVMRAKSLEKTPHAIISRALAGIRKDTLIINLPGSPKAAIENLEAIWSAVPHAILKLQGDPSDCAAPPNKGSSR